MNYIRKLSVTEKRVLSGRFSHTYLEIEELLLEVRVCGSRWRPERHYDLLTRRLSCKMIEKGKENGTHISLWSVLQSFQLRSGVCLGKLMDQI
jgi:hypothetical protein